MKKIITNLTSLALIALFFLVPHFASAQSFDLVVCGSKEQGYQCTFADLMTMVRNLINALVALSTLLATIAFAWMGFLLVTSGGNESKKNEAKAIGKKVLTGYLWILAAWVLVATLFNVILKPEYSLLK
jgi:hypothetical protein